jgi:shikimate dehydrogenase
MNIDGHTQLIAHIGYPTHSFKAPLIYNPYFEQAGINACVMPMACQRDNFAALIAALRPLENFAGALITMPHKIDVLKLLDASSPTARIAGSCNAIRLNEQGQLIGDMFDGEGFVRGVHNKGFETRGIRALVVGSGGVGSAIAASLAAAEVAELALFDVNIASCDQLAGRLRAEYPELIVRTGSNDPAGFELVVNATPMGMNEGDPLPMDIERINPAAFVGEVVMRAENTAFITAARARGCRVQVGVDMLFEQIPAYLEFFGLPTTSAAELRKVARIRY